MDSVIDSNAARSSSASSRRRNNNTSSSEGAVTIHVRNAEEGDESNQLIRNNNNAGDAAETNETKEDHAADHKSLVASSSSDEEAAKKKALDERVDAAAVAARDPYSPSMPFGSGLEKTKSTATTSSQEGLAQMQHSNPSSVAELFGFNSPEDADYSETNPTGNVGKFPRKVLLQIAKRFQPIVWLSPTEQYRPCRMEWYLDHANLYYDPVGASKFGDYILVKERPADTDLNADRLFELLVAAKERTKDPRLDLLERGNMQVRRFHMAIRDEASQEGEPWEQLNQVPFLTRIRRYKDRWEIVYIFIYAFNGPFTVCCKPQNAHSCDVEHVTVRTDPLAQRAEWVYYGAHGSADGVWKLPGEVEMRKGDMEWNTRPVVYAADFSHGIYPSPGLWCRICGFANDHATASTSEDGVHSEWNPTVDPVMLLDSELDRPGLGYLAYAGTMGEDGTAPPQNQAWWAQENTYNNNFFRRCLWPCRYCECNNEMCYNYCQWHNDFNRGKTKEQIAEADRARTQPSYSPSPPPELKGLNPPFVGGGAGSIGSAAPTKQTMSA